ncbi:MAG: tRNA (adenosine(37)-N6)-dimethylallyltransferase MiaA [Chitinophagaceae bacterium]|nr:tRNA (adenosine(37)-N6)-dimethylallyltransferase MiaA [Chitinophagaceae bacterium]
MSDKKPLLVVVAGPTASGKTATAISLARHYQTHILSADSRQCFREMTIGVAKPTEDELAQAHHYFINTHSITESVDAAAFETYALKALKEIFSSKDIAIAAGGTGLYIKALCEGIDAMPLIDEDIRKQVRNLFETNGLKAIAEALQNEDPLFANSGEMQNPQRMMRALEVVRQTGRSIRTFQQGRKSERFFDVIYLGMEIPKETLHQRINLRVDQMLAAGLEDEVRSLLPYRKLNALQTVGYKEFFDYFDGNLSKAEAINQIKIHTRQYAKRQMTWFRKITGMRWFSPDDLSGMIGAIDAFRANNQVNISV